MRNSTEQSSDNQVELSQQKQTQTFACPWEGCGRLFRAQFSLNRHMLLHTETKKYACRFCDRKFSLPQYLREHEYTHTKELPYECGVAGCKLRFRQAGKLSLHRRTHPEYLPMKYDYSLNREKRTKVKQRQVQIEKPVSDEDKYGPTFKVTKVPTDTPLCNCSDDTKLHSHGHGADDCSLPLKPLPPLLLSYELLAAHDRTANSPGGSHCSIHMGGPPQLGVQEGAAVVPLMEYLNRSINPCVKPVLPLPPVGSDATKSQCFCTLDLFALIKEHEQ